MRRIPDDEYNHDDVARFAKRLIDRWNGANRGTERELAAHWKCSNRLHPHEALRSALRRGYLGLDNDIESIEVGSWLVSLLDADPSRPCATQSACATLFLAARCRSATIDKVATPSERPPLSWDGRRPRRPNAIHSRRLWLLASLDEGALCDV